MIKTTTFSRKPFDVEAVQVTDENMDAVAEWCQGEICYGVSDRPEFGPAYIKVRVHRPMTRKQTEAHVGDYVSYTPSGYKVYTQKAFEKSFEPARARIVNHPMSDISGDKFINMDTDYQIHGRFDASVNEGVLNPDAVLREQIVSAPGINAIVTTEVSHSHEGPVCSSRCPANKKYSGPTISGQTLPVENLQFND